MMYAVVDIEGTGFASKENRITEISIFIYDGKCVVNEFTTLINPEFPLSKDVVNITGITNEMAMRAPKFSEVAKNIVKITTGCIFVAHNVNFDYNIIKSQLKELGIDFHRQKICTLRLAKKIIPGRSSYKLASLCEYFNITVRSFHRARNDAEATLALLEKLLTSF